MNAHYDNVLFRQSCPEPQRVTRVVSIGFTFHFSPPRAVLFQASRSPNSAPKTPSVTPRRPTVNKGPRRTTLRHERNPTTNRRTAITKTTHQRRRKHQKSNQRIMTTRMKRNILMSVPMTTKIPQRRRHQEGQRVRFEMWLNKRQLGR